MNVLHFITAIPLNFQQGSGCYMGIRTLTEGLGRLGVRVSMVTPRTALRVFAARRILFNETLRRRVFEGDATVGIDADGYAIAGQRRSLPHVACIKGVMGDVIRFESGATRASMALQARLEAKHARRADLVITISKYCAERIEELYGVSNATVVPELIDLESWRQLFHANPAAPDPRKFTVLSVCRFYPRKRVDLLLQAAAQLRDRIPQLEVRIVGNGLEGERLRALSNELHLGSVVQWLGDVSPERLASEYNRAHVFCLPSIQEGFGIVFLEAMAAGKPIVAARASAVPEVVHSGILVDPNNAEALAEGLFQLFREPDLRDALGTQSRQDVEEFEVGRVSRRFLSEVAKVAPGIRICSGAGGCP